MSFTFIAAAALLGSDVSVTQLDLVQPEIAPVQSTPGTVVTGPTSQGTFSGGGGTCATAVSVGTGPTAVNFAYDITVAASGGVATNPFAALCDFAGTGIDNEEWFSWTAGSDGAAQLSACSGIGGLDTKIAIYANNCAAIMTLDPLACKDNSGGCPAGETVITWDITAGTTYLIQFGTPPTFAGGAGNFSITEQALADGQYDLGVSYNALGFPAVPGDILFAHAYDAGAGEMIDSVEVAWGLNGGTQMPAGGPATLVVYQGSPGTGLAFQYSEAITTASENTDTFVNYALTTPQFVVGTYSVAIVYQVTAPPIFPAAFDDTVTPQGRSWIALETLSLPLDIMDPTTAEQPAINLFDVVWLLRVNTSAGMSNFPEGCSGDGGDGMGCTDCPCGNNTVSGTVGGCINSNGTGGRLIASGSTSVTAPDPSDLRMEMSGGVPSSFAVLTSGNSIAPANAANPCFGLDSGLQSAVLDGLRCAVQQTQRHGGRPVDANGDVGVTTNGWGGANGPPGGLAAQGGFPSGQTRHYQVFYRELPGLICLTEQNTTQAVTVVFTP